VNEPRHWWWDAACYTADPEAFHPGSADGAEREALAVCATCTVRVQCLDWGLYDPHGVWGGWPEAARARLRAELDKIPQGSRAGVIAAAALNGPAMLNSRQGVFTL